VELTSTLIHHYHRILIIIPECLVKLELGLESVLAADIGFKLDLKLYPGSNKKHKLDFNIQDILIKLGKFKIIIIFNIIIFNIICLGQEDLILINSILNQNMAKLMNEKGELLIFLIRNKS